MNRLLKLAIVGVAVAIIGVVSVPSAHAMLHVFICHDHPNGAIVPPTYGLRIDDLIGDGEFTFSFDYADMSGAASVTLVYDDVLGQIHIYGRVYGGKDLGGGWDPALKGWMDIDFTYTQDLSVSESCAGGVGDDLYVHGMSSNNNGTFSLDGWGGNAVFYFEGKPDVTGCSFVFDNDTDSKGNATIAGDPSQWSASGWLMPETTGSRDWLFVAEAITVPVEATTWGQVKALYGDE